MKKPWVVIFRPFTERGYGRAYVVRTFRSEARAGRYAARRDRWSVTGDYRAVHYTVWNDYLTGKDGIA